MILIGITGKAGVGKDTLADKIIERYGGVKLGFADSIKNACKELFQLSHEQLHIREEKEKKDPRWDKSPRELMQILGTDLLRNHFDENIFIKSTLERIKKLSIKNEIIIVSDCRFENETQMIRNLNGIIIHLTRPKVKHINNHISENTLKIFVKDIELINNSSIENLIEKIKMIFVI